MIISGYPGIGKTTVARKRVDIVDLDSSLFKGKDGDIDFNGYFKVAKALSDQGYIVLVSAHDEIREKLIELATYEHEPVAEIFPSKSYKEFWIERLCMRWEQTGDEKDRRAYCHVRMNFDDDIDIRIQQPCGLIQTVVKRMPYDLEEEIEWTVYHANNVEECHEMCH